MQRPRSEAKKRQVAQLLERGLPVHEVIKKIRSIDRAEEQDVGTEADDGDDRAHNDGRRRPLRYGTAQLSILIKTPRLRAGCLDYVFHHRRRIQGAGRFSAFLTPSLIPARVRILGGLHAFFRNELRPRVSRVLELIEPVLQSAWLVLEKREYNVLVLLKRFCEKARMTNFALISHKDSDFIDKMRAVETLFLALIYDRKNIDSIFEALKIVAQTGEADEAVTQEIGGSVAWLLKGKGAAPSLFDVVLGLNTVKYRRYIKPEDLISHDLGDIVNDRVYAASEDVAEAISVYVERLKKKLDELVRALTEARRLVKHVTVDEAGRVDVRSMRALYEDAATAEGGGGFDADRNDVMALVPHLLKQFLFVFTPLLRDQVSIRTQGRCTVFPHDAFHTEFARLERVVGALEARGRDFRHFSYARYLELHRTRQGATEAEAEVLQIVDESISALLALARGLSPLLPDRNDNSDWSDENEAPVGLFGTPTVPYAHETIRDDTVIGGKTVEEALRYAVEVCYLAAAHLGDEHVNAYLGKQHTLGDDIVSSLKVLKRFAGETACERYRVHLTALQNADV